MRDSKARVYTGDGHLCYLAPRTRADGVAASRRPRTPRVRRGGNKCHRDGEETMQKIERERLETARLRLELAAMVSNAMHRVVRGKRRVDQHAQTLSRWLDDVAFFVHTPETGVDLILSFFEMDVQLLSGCTDIDDTLKQVFTQNAFPLLRNYARRLQEFPFSLGERILDGARAGRDEIREILLSYAADYMPADVIRHLCERAKNHARACGLHTQDGYRWLDLAAVLAREALDEENFLDILRAMYGEIPDHAHVIVAEIRIRRGDFHGAAQKLLEREPADEDLDLWDDLGLQVLDNLMDAEEKRKFFLDFFRMRRNAELLSEVPRLFPGKSSEEFAREESEHILQNVQFSTYDATFLVDAGFPETADRYVAARRARFASQNPARIEELADLLAYNRGSLGATLLFRHLLEVQMESASMDLDKALSYLNMVELLGERVDNWGSLPDTETYLQDLYARFPGHVEFWAKAGWFDEGP